MSILSSSTPSKSILVLVHGILTGGTSPTWPQRAAAVAARTRPDLITITSCYNAGPFPRFNYLVTNRRVVRKLRRRVELYPRELPINLVSHSNGGPIILKLAEQLLEAGRKVESMTLIASAAPSSVATLERRFPRVMGEDGPDLEAWSSPRDRAVSPWIWPLRWVRWPWGDMGGRGFDPLQGPRHRTIMHPEYRHTTWFNARADETIEALLDRASKPQKPLP